MTHSILIKTSMIMSMIMFLGNAFFYMHWNIIIRLGLGYAMVVQVGEPEEGGFVIKSRSMNFRMVYFRDIDFFLCQSVMLKSVKFTQMG